MYNKYANISSLLLLKSNKPRKAFPTAGPDLANFYTSNPDLKRLLNFNMVMLQFLPDFERLAYAGKMRAKAGDEGSVTFLYDGDKEANVTGEWWDAFNQHEMSVADAQAAGLTNIGAYDDGDGYINNYENVRWAEGEGIKDDGFTKWRTNWIAGKCHGVGQFDGTYGIAGQGTGTYYKNIDFTGNSCNLIKQRKGTGDDLAALAIANQAHFINGSEYEQSFNLLDAIGADWDDVQTLLNDTLGGQSFYNIVMNESYTSLSARQATLLVGAMYEYRERPWQAMSEVFGAVENTRNDSAMISTIDSFVLGNNPYANSKALGIFPFFLQIQHSAINRMSAFFKKGAGDNWEASKLDRQKFGKFVRWLGGEKYNNVDTDESGEVNDGGMLYSYRDDNFDEGSAGYNAVSTLIDKWFGATKVENRRPVSETYHEPGEQDWPEGDDAPAGSWYTIPSTTVKGWNGSWGERVATQAFVPDTTNPGCGWDRKWYGRLYVKDGGGTVYQVDSANGYGPVMNHLWQAGAITSHLNPNSNGQSHAHYAISQLDGLSFNAWMRGQEFSNNWVVHAMGMYMRWATGIDNWRVQDRLAKMRRANKVFKKDISDYSERVDELIYEEKAAERVASKRKRERKEQIKEAAKKSRTSKQLQEKLAKQAGARQRKAERSFLKLMAQKQRSNKAAQRRQENA